MKTDSASLFLHGNAVLLLVFCVLYSYLYHGNFSDGLLAWVIGLAFSYSFNLMKNPQLPEEVVTVTKKFSPFLGWAVALSLFGVQSDNSFLRLASSIPLFFSVILTLYSQKMYSRMYFNFGFILCGEVKYLKEIREYITKNVSTGLIELTESTFSQENLCIMEESEWHTSQFKEKGRLAWGGEMNENGYFTFAGVLHGSFTQLEQMRMHISDTYLLDGLVKSFKTTYSKERLYMVKELE